MSRRKEETSESDNRRNFALSLLFSFQYWWILSEEYYIPFLLLLTQLFMSDYSFSSLVIHIHSIKHATHHYLPIMSTHLILFERKISNANRWRVESHFSHVDDRHSSSIYGCRKENDFFSSHTRVYSLLLHKIIYRQFTERNWQNDKCWKRPATRWIIEWISFPYCIKLLGY